MRAELLLDYDELANQISLKVIQAIKPLLAQNKQNDDIVFTVESLAKYLQVEPSWIYKQVSLKTIPYFKSGKYTRFRKRDIDRWIENQAVKPIPDLKIQKF